MQRRGDGNFGLRIRVAPFANGERHGKDPIEQIPGGKTEDSFFQVSQSQTEDPVTTIRQTDRQKFGQVTLVG